MTDVIKPQLHTYRGAEWGKRKTKTKIQVTSLVFGSGFPVSSDLSPLHVGGADGGKKNKKTRGAVVEESQNRAMIIKAS